MSLLTSKFKSRISTSDFCLSALVTWSHFLAHLVILDCDFMHKWLQTLRMTLYFSREAVTFFHLRNRSKVPRWWLEGGSRKRASKVKSWRHVGDTLCRKNHQEEAKLWHLHTTSLCIASPLHIKWRNQEGSCATRRQCQPCLGEPDHQIPPLLLLQARQYWITHSTRTATIARAMRGRRKKEGNHFPPNNKLVQESEG
jgi:hypothetical protein